MVGDIVGYCLIKKDAKSFISIAKLETFTKQACRVMEFGVDGCAMIINPEASAIATVDKEDIIAKFECSVHADFICPPNLDFTEQMMYTTKLMTRKGGYAPILRDMVIAASLHSGKFNDNFLWQNQ